MSEALGETDVLALPALSPPISRGIMTFSSAEKSGMRKWNWKTKPTSLFLNPARALLPILESGCPR